MKYLVNRETKEHAACPEWVTADMGIWHIVEADDEGWIAWSGGKCPLPQLALVQIRTLSGNFSGCTGEARQWQWENNDIIAYRPILPAEWGNQDMPTWSNVTITDKFPDTVSHNGETLKLVGVVGDGSVFDRLAAAVTASESIPALIAEINALLPEGYEVREKAKVKSVMPNPDALYDFGQKAEQAAEDMSDWRKWKAGDLLECIVAPTSWWARGKIYRVQESERGLCVLGDDGDERKLNGVFQLLKFHSRPVTK